MNYQKHTDEELRQVLIADPYDAMAICEAADRFVAQAHEDEQVFRCNECYSYDVSEVS